MTKITRRVITISVYRLAILMFSFGLAVSGCSQGISTLDKRVMLIKSSAEDITERQGTAKGKNLSGIFELKIWYGQMNCRSTSKYDAIEALENQVQEIPCKQDDGHFECTWIDGTVYEGYLDQDGSFGLAGEFMFEIEEGETTPAPTTATGIFSPAGKAEGSIMVAAKGRQENSKATCLLTYSFELQKKNAKPKEEGSASDSKTLKLTVQSGQGFEQRLFGDVRVREDRESIAVGAKGEKGERVVAQIQADGSAEVSAHLVDRANHTLFRGVLANCLIEPSETTWSLICETAGNGL